MDAVSCGDAVGMGMVDFGHFGGGAKGNGKMGGWKGAVEKRVGGMIGGW